MQDKTINNALLALRKQAIQGDGEGLHHVEALLTARGVDMPRVMPAKRSDAARQNEMRRIVKDALKDGPRSLREITEYVTTRRPMIDYRRAYQRTSRVLWKMKLDGLVRHEGGFWLAP